MTDASVEQQGVSKKRRRHPGVPQAADSSSSSSESSTDTEMGLVDVCKILCDNSEAEGRCEGCPITQRTRSKLGRFCTWHSFVNYKKYKCARDGIFFTHFRTPPRAGTSQQLWIS